MSLVFVLPTLNRRPPSFWDILCPAGRHHRLEPTQPRHVDPHRPGPLNTTSLDFAHPIPWPEHELGGSRESPGPACQEL